MNTVAGICKVRLKQHKNPEFSTVKFQTYFLNSEKYVLRVILRHNVHVKT